MTIGYNHQDGKKDSENRRVVVEQPHQYLARRARLERFEVLSGPSSWEAAGTRIVSSPSDKDRKDFHHRI